MRPQVAYKAFVAVAALWLWGLSTACRGPAGESETTAPRAEATPSGRLVSEAASLARAELIQADRAFSESVRAGRLESWVAAFDQEGMVLPAEGPIAIGPEAIRDLFLPLFAEPTFEITWAPSGAEAARSGDFGFTFGDWKTSTESPDGDLEQTEGKYLTVWRKGPDGKWRVLADIGNTSARSAAAK